MSSSYCSGFSGLMSLEELRWGVVKTFKPRDAELVGCYLYNKIMMDHGENGKQPFPELEIYGKTAMEPWIIWDSIEAVKLTHQEFLYFFSRVKKLSNKGIGKRLSRKVGCGGTWSETEPAKPVYVDGVQEPFGKIRKFRYENKDKSFEYHTAWMMEEFSIDHHCVNSSDLVLCRMKRNENMKKKNRKFVEDDEENARRTKSFKPEEQLTSHSHHEQQQQWQISDFTPQEWFDVDDLLCDGSDDEQFVEEQGSSIAHQQQISAPYLDNNYICTTTDAVIVSQNVSVDAQLEDTSWLEELNKYNFRDECSLLGWDDIDTATTLPQSPSFAQLLGD